MSANAPLNLLYLGCEGVLVRSGGAAVLIDGLFGSEAAPFAMPDEGALAKLRAARPPFDGVNAVIATHAHDDHFDPGAVADYLRASRRTHFVSTPQAVARLTAVAGDAFANRVHAVPPVEGERTAMDAGGVTVECFGLSHGRVHYADVEQNGVLVRLGERSVVHLGDGIIDEKSLRAAGVVEAATDVGVLPFWFMTYPFGRRLAERGFKPRTRFAVHIRVSEREQVVNEVLESGDAFPLVSPMTRYDVDGGGRIEETDTQEA